jgi:hypothetical protein
MFNAKNKAQVREFSDAEFQALKKKASWAISDGEKYGSARCEILIVKMRDSDDEGEEGFYETLVFTDFLSGTVQCVDCRTGMTLQRALNQASEQMFEENVN